MPTLVIVVAERSEHSWLYEGVCDRVRRSPSCHYTDSSISSQTGEHIKNLIMILLPVKYHFNYLTNYLTIIFPLPHHLGIISESSHQNYSPTFKILSQHNSPPKVLLQVSHHSFPLISLEVQSLVFRHKSPLPFTLECQLKYLIIIFLFPNLLPFPKSTCYKVNYLINLSYLSPLSKVSVQLSHQKFTLLPHSTRKIPVPLLLLKRIW